MFFSSRITRKNINIAKFDKNLAKGCGSENLKNTYDEIYLVRNELHFKIYGGFEYPYVNGQNPLKSTLNSFEKRGYSKSSITLMMVRHLLQILFYF